jgi:ribose transport system substrate-binding protein
MPRSNYSPIVFAVLASVFASGFASTSWATGKRIGMASREITNDYNRGIIAGAQKVIEAAGDTMVVVDGGADPRKHNENIENLINSHVDGLIIQLGNAQQLAPEVAKAKAAGIPVVTTSVGALTEGALTEVGGDEDLMATLMSRALLSSIGYQGDIYVVLVPGAPLLETRKRVLEAMVKDYPKVKLHEVPTEHSAAKVQAQMEDILTANPQPGSIAAVWGAYDLLTSGAVQAIRQAGRNEIKSASIDGDRVGFQMLLSADSPFVATVAQDVPHIGELAGQTIEEALAGKKDFPGLMFTDAYVATRANGIAAAERRWGKDVWKEIEMDPKEIATRFPQTESVLVVRPTLP